MVGLYDARVTNVFDGSGEVRQFFYLAIRGLWYSQMAGEFEMGGFVEAPGCDVGSWHHSLDTSVLNTRHPRNCGEFTIANWEQDWLVGQLFQ